MFAKYFDFELVHFAIRRTDGLLFQIDCQLVAHFRSHRLEQLLHLFRSQADRQQTVLETVVEKDVGKAGRDDGAETVVFQCPRRVFARRSAAEVFACEQNLRAFIARLIQHEIRIERTHGIIPSRLAVIEIAPFVEQIRAETGTLDRLQKLLRNDRIGIHIGPVQLGDQPIQHGKFLHYDLSAFSSFSPVFFNPRPTHSPPFLIPLTAALPPFLMAGSAALTPLSMPLAAASPPFLIPRPAASPPFLIPLPARSTTLSSANAVRPAIKPNATNPSVIDKTAIFFMPIPFTLYWYRQNVRRLLLP